MIIPSSFSKKTVVVLGLGRSGLSAAQALLRADAQVLAWDDKEESRKAAKEEGIPLLSPATLNWKTVQALVLSPGIPHTFPSPHPLVQQAKEEGITPISDIEVLSLTHPDSFYIGITGTNGKSTTTALLGHCLAEHKMHSQVGGNIGIPVCNLEPEGLYILELSSYQLELSPHFHPNLGILLNITPDHLDRHGGMEGYVAAKERLFHTTTAQDTAVISLDDPYCAKIYTHLKEKEQKPHLVPFSVKTLLPEGIAILEGKLYENGAPLIDVREFESLKGVHNWQNIAAAYGALRTLDLPQESLFASLSSFPGLMHRQQVIKRHRQVTFVNDSKGTNAEATEKALKVYGGKPLYWLLGGVAKAGGISSLMPYFPTITHAFVFGEAASEFAEALEGKVPFTHCRTLQDATEAAAALAFANSSSNAVVLLSPACASFDQFRDFEERGRAFCDYVENITSSSQKNFTSPKNPLK